MRKIVVYIDCDVCSRTYSSLTNLVCGSDPSQWLTIARDLECFAQLSGWHCYHEQHTCFDCLMEQMHPEEFGSA